MINPIKETEYHKMMKNQFKPVRRLAKAYQNVDLDDCTKCMPEGQFKANSPNKFEEALTVGKLTDRQVQTGSGDFVQTICPLYPIEQIKLIYANASPIDKKKIIEYFKSQDTQTKQILHRKQ